LACLFSGFEKKISGVFYFCKKVSFFQELNMYLPNFRIKITSVNNACERFWGFTERQNFPVNLIMRSFLLHITLPPIAF
jgi:hypothetical protein